LEEGFPANRFENRFATFHIVRDLNEVDRDEGLLELSSERSLPTRRFNDTASGNAALGKLENPKGVL
jgi:hypothetical protein